MKKIVIIGAGASGLMAAAESAKKGNDVTVIEKMQRPARKVLISGKGRCNVTNACFDMEELISNVPTNPRFLYSAFSNFMPYDTIAFLEEMGVETKIERGNRVFPVSDKAVDIVDALVRNAKNCGVKIITGTAKAFEFENNLVKAVVLEEKSRIECDSAAVCTGGKSYPATGSTGDGYTLARSAGHTIIRIRPSLVPLVCSNNFTPKLQGLSLKNISVKLQKDNKTIYTDFGEMLFTHFGVSGPMILTASRHIIKDLQYQNFNIEIDLKPALDDKEFDLRLQKDFMKYSNKNFKNSLDDLLPKKFIPVMIDIVKIDPYKKINSITKQERKRILDCFKHLIVNVEGLRPVSEAIVTSGGIDVSEINPSTMKSKIIRNLSFAGEVMDVDAFTGGYNVQIAISTGFLAGNSI